MEQRQESSSIQEELKEDIFDVKEEEEIILAPQSFATDKGDDKDLKDVKKKGAFNQILETKNLLGLVIAFGDSV